MRVSSAFLVAAALVAALVSPVLAQKGDSLGRPGVGSKFPGIALPDVNGKQVYLNDFKGKAILLSFWSCYTDTCYTSVPVIQDLLKEYASRGLVAPTVCSEVPPALAKDGYAGLLKQCGTGQIVLIDAKMEFAKRLGVTEFPTTYLIDRNYTVWQVITGIRPLMTEDFRVLVKSLVSE